MQTEEQEKFHRHKRVVKGNRQTDQTFRHPEQVVTLCLYWKVNFVNLDISVKDKTACQNEEQAKDQKN